MPGNSLKEFSGKGPVAGMIFRKLGQGQHILQQGKDSVEKILIPGHTSFQGCPG